MRNMTTLAILLSASTVAAAQQPQDMINLKDGTVIQECEIKTLTYKRVEYDIIVNTRVAQNVEAKRVADYVLDKDKSTHDFNEGTRAMEANVLGEAIDRFEKAKRDTSPRSRDIVRQTAAINIVRCQFWADNMPGCIAAIQSLRQVQPESFYLKESYEFEIKCCLRKGDTAGAQGAISALEAKGNAENLPEWARAADVLRGGLFEKQSKPREALAIYRKYTGDKDAGDDAKIGELRCLYATGDWAGLNVRAQAILAELRGKKSINDRLWTAAYNASGEVGLHDNKPKDALLDFMQGVAVYSRSGSSPEHEVSLARAGIACARLATAEKEKAKKDLWKGRAIDQLTDLRRQYGNGPMAAELKKAIDEVK